MGNLPWLEDYEGQTTSDLIGLGGTYDVASLVDVFQQGLAQKSCRLGRRPSFEEQVIASVMALDQEVKNGGYAQFLKNSSGSFANVVVEALERIGSGNKADVTRRALTALPVGWEQLSIKQLSPQLDAFDKLYYADKDDIFEHLFRYICENTTKFELP